MHETFGAMPETKENEDKKKEASPSRKLDSFTKNELKKIAVSNGGILTNVLLDGLVNGQPLEGGWTITILREETVNGERVGVLALGSSHRELRDLLKKGRINRFMSAGLSEVDAQKLDTIKMSHKSTVVGRLAEALIHDPIKKAYLAFPDEKDPGMQIVSQMKWRREFRDILGERINNISLEQEQSLAKLVRAMC